VVLTTLAVARCGPGSCHIARLLDKHPTTVHRWPRLGLQLEQSGTAFLAHIHRLEAANTYTDLDNAEMRYVAA
jgi:hypothetical protein